MESPVRSSDKGTPVACCSIREGAEAEGTSLLPTFLGGLPLRPGILAGWLVAYGWDYLNWRIFAFLLFIITIFIVSIILVFPRRHTQSTNFTHVSIQIYKASLIVGFHYFTVSFQRVIKRSLLWSQRIIKN